MTLKELSQLYWLNREIEADQRRLDELERLRGSPSSPQLTGMPHAPNRNDSKVERLAAEIVDLQAIIAARQIQCIHERARLERWISDIPDSLTRQVFTLRFVDGLQWPQVAVFIGEGTTPDRAKKICYRYIDRQDARTERQLREAEKASREYEQGLRSRP
jgi:hypothetical protein